MAIGVVSGAGAFGSGSIFTGVFSVFDVVNSAFESSSATKAEAKAKELWRPKDQKDARWEQFIARVSILRSMCSVLSWVSCRVGSVIAKTSYIFFFIVKGLGGLVSCMRACKGLLDLCYYERQSEEAVSKEMKVDAKKKAIAACMNFLGNLFLVVLVALELAGLIFSLAVAPWLSIPLTVAGLGAIIGAVFLPGLIYRK